MMSSSINLDLDFQDYTPTRGNEASSSGQQQQSKSQQSGLVSNLAADQAGRTRIQMIPNNPNSSHSQSNLSDQMIQQLIRASGKHHHQQQQQQKVAPSNISGSWGMAYFSQYFDITTSDVLQRILWSTIPLRKAGLDLDDTELLTPLSSDMINNDGGGSSDSVQVFLEQLNAKQKSLSYMERFIQSRPDLYGPFWVSTTLIFAVAIFSNLISFLNYKSKLYQTEENKLNSSTNTMLNGLSNFQLNENQLDEWHYSMDELNTTASVITFYITIIPTFLWFLFWFRGCAKYYTLMETVCAYGYSMSIFIPLAALLMIQETIFRYLVLGLTSLLSGLVLMMSFVPIVKRDPNTGSSHIVLLIIPALHFGLAYVLHRIMLQSQK